MVGAFGLSTEIYPTGVTGPTNRFNDLGIDAQVEHKLSEGMLIGRASYIHESQRLSAAFAATPASAQNLTNSLDRYKFNVSYIPNTTHTVTLGIFGTVGTNDNVVYAPSPTSGSSTASPASQGESLEVTANPWLNVRVGAQYVVYQKFNGASRSYDVLLNGRNAKDNNTLYCYMWLAF